MTAGVDYIGVGVGALIFNDQGQFLMGLRGPAAKNEQGRWEIPGGAVEFGETLEAALIREILEEIGVEIEIKQLLHVSTHLLPAEKQHWVSPTYLCHIKSGQPRRCEPDKCQELRWVSIEEAALLPLSIVTASDIEYLINHPELKLV